MVAYLRYCTSTWTAAQRYDNKRRESRRRGDKFCGSFMVSGGQTTTVRITLALFLASCVRCTKIQADCVNYSTNSTCQTWRNCACLCWSLVIAGRDYRRLDWHSFPTYTSLECAGHWLFGIIKTRPTLFKKNT